MRNREINLLQIGKSARVGVRNTGEGGIKRNNIFKNMHLFPKRNTNIGYYKYILIKNKHKVASSLSPGCCYFTTLLIYTSVSHSGLSMLIIEQKYGSKQLHY